MSGSLPTRGAWIEISRQYHQGESHHKSLPTRGAWIEILYHIGAYNVDTGRSPHGERGLKLTLAISAVLRIWSLPTRGAWIEMSANYVDPGFWQVAPHTGSVD